MTLYQHASIGKGTIHKEIWLCVFSTRLNHTQWNSGTIKVGTHVWTCEERIGSISL